MIVLDASAAFELVAGSATGEVIVRRIGSDAIGAPSFMCLEVASVLRRFVARGQWRASSAQLALGDLLALGISWWPPELLVERAFELRGSLTAYDATYVALAELLGVPLVTCDQALAGANGHDAEIEVVQAR